MLLLLIIPLALLFWYLAVRTRQTHACPECGEVIMVEQMSATRCNTCGALLSGKVETDG